MFEYAIVLLAIRRSNHFKNFLDDPMPTPDGKSDTRAFAKKKKLWEMRKERARTADRKKDDFCYQVDRGAFIIFAAAFFIFNIVYAAIYS